jgi:hypothetical protein
MNSIQQDLEALGETSDQVADKLRKLGIKGDRFSPTSCPIYNYLCKQGHDTVCSVDYSNYKREAVAVKTSIYDASYGEEDSIKECFHIRPVVDFIMAFDDEQYLDLVSPSCKR